MYLKYPLGFLARARYCISVPDWYLVPHGLRCQKKQCKWLINKSIVLWPKHWITSLRFLSDWSWRTWSNFYRRQKLEKGPLFVVPKVSAHNPIFRLRLKIGPCALDIICLSLIHLSHRTCSCIQQMQRARDTLKIGGVGVNCGNEFELYVKNRVLCKKQIYRLDIRDGHPCALGQLNIFLRFINRKYQHTLTQDFW